VYALGVILYELLTGRLPYKVGRNLHQAVLTIREEDPAPLSSVNRIYRGDVETIVAKALEKQKARRYYGLLERQFRNYYEKASRMPGVTGENLLTLLECRLDNVLVRLGFAASRRQARQLVRHGHWTVNGRRVDIPSYQVRPGDVIAVKAGTPAQQVIRDATELTGQVPAWLQADHDGLTAKVLRKPERREVAAPVQEQLIVELYSK